MTNEEFHHTAFPGLLIPLLLPSHSASKQRYTEKKSKEND